MLLYVVDRRTSSLPVDMMTNVYKFHSLRQVLSISGLENPPLNL